MRETSLLAEYSVADYNWAVEGGPYTRQAIWAVTGFLTCLPAAAWIDPRKTGGIVAYFDNCRTPEDLDKAIENVRPDEFPPDEEFRGHVRITSEGLNYCEPDWGKVYRAARECALGLRRADPSLPNLPVHTDDPHEGILTIQEWCIDAEREGETPYDPAPDNGTSQTDEKPVTLAMFLEQHCKGPLKDSQVTRYKKALFDAQRRKKIKLPSLARTWRKGESRYFSPTDLRKAWPKYLKAIPQLPDITPPTK